MFLAGEAAVGVGLARGGAVGTEGEVAGAAAADHAPAIVIAHDAVAAQMVGVQVQQVVALAGDDLPYGDGLSGEEVGAAAGDGVAAVDVAVALWALWRGGGNGVIVGEGQPFGLQGFGPGAGLDAVFVLAGTGAPGVTVGEEQQPAGVVAFGGDDEGDGGLVLSRYLHFIPAGAEHARAAGSAGVVPHEDGRLLQGGRAVAEGRSDGVSLQRKRLCRSERLLLSRLVQVRNSNIRCPILDRAHSIAQD